MKGRSHSEVCAILLSFLCTVIVCTLNSANQKGTTNSPQQSVHTQRPQWWKTGACPSCLFSEWPFMQSQLPPFSHLQRLQLRSSLMLCCPNVWNEGYCVYAHCVDRGERRLLPKLPLYRRFWTMALLQGLPICMNIQMATWRANVTGKQPDSFKQVMAACTTDHPHPLHVLPSFYIWDFTRPQMSFLLDGLDSMACRVPSSFIVLRW